MWLKLCRNDILCVSDRLNRRIESTSVCIESSYMETTVFYARRGETSRDLSYSLKACHANCMHRQTFVVVWKTLPFHDEKLIKKYLIYSRNYSNQHRDEEKNEFYNTNSLVSILKISMITWSRTRRSPFTYNAWLMWSPLRDRTMHNVESPCLKTSDEEFLKRISDLRDYCMESELIGLMWGASTMRSYI